MGRVVTLLAEATREVRTGAEAGTLADGIVRTVAYADVFDFALTPTEIHRYLIGVAASPPQVAAALGRRLDDGLRGRVSAVDGLVTLAGREELAARRIERRRASARLWPRAVRYARAVASLPFVRMVAVSGALAAGNAADGDDIDVFIVTETGRLWLARAGSIAIVRMARLEGHELCPNYLLAEHDLRLDERDLYGATELGRMIPIVGRPVYERMRALNAWTAELLPDAGGAPSAPGTGRGPVWQPARTVAEAVLRTRLGSALERWEQGRKVARFRRMAASDVDGDADAGFSADRCKGHFVSHRRRIRDAYEARCGRFEVRPMWYVTEERRVTEEHHLPEERA